MVFKRRCFNLRGSHVLGRDKGDRRDGPHLARARAGYAADAFALSSSSFRGGGTGRKASPILAHARGARDNSILFS